MKAWNILLAPLVPSLIAFPFIASAQTAFPSDYEIPYRDGAATAYGFDLYGGNLKRTVCIKNAVRKQVGDGTKPIGRFIDFFLVQDTAQLFRSMNASASGSYGKGLANVSASANFSSEYNFETNSSWIYGEKVMKYSYETVDPKATGEQVSGTEVKLDEKKRDLLRKKGLDAFRQQCGDGYISLISKGGRLLGRAEFVSTSKKEKQTFEANISGGNALASGTVSIDQKNIASSTNKQSRIKILEIGLGERKDVTDVQGFLNNFNIFGEADHKEFKQAPYSMIITSYTELAEWPKDQPEYDLKGIATVLSELNEIFIRLNDLAKRYEVVRSSPKDYYNIYYRDWDDFDKQYDQLYVNLALIERLMSNCINSIGKCAGKGLNRKETIALLSQENAKNRNASVDLVDAYLRLLKPQTGKSAIGSISSDKGIVELLPNGRKATLLRQMQQLDLAKAATNFYTWEASIPLEKRAQDDELDALITAKNLSSLRADINALENQTGQQDDPANSAILANYHKPIVDWAIETRFVPNHKRSCDTTKVTNLCQTKIAQMASQLQVSLMGKGIQGPPAAPPSPPPPSPPPPRERQPIDRPCMGRHAMPC